LNKKKQLRLFNCSETLSRKVRDTIERNNGIIESELKEVFGCHEIKLKGKPWSGIGDKYLHSRQLICRITETMLCEGWSLVSSVTLTRSSSDKGVLLFSKDQACTADVACLAMTGQQSITFIDFPVRDRNTLREEVERVQCVSGIQSEGCKENNCYQIELKGSIWSSSELLALHARSALIHLLKKANSLGWELAVSADVSSKYYPNDNGPDYPEDVDSWYFIRRHAGQGSKVQVSKHSLEGTSLTVDLPPSYEDVMNNS